MKSYRLLEGVHGGKGKVVHQPGDIVHSDVDLVKKFGAHRFKEVTPKEPIAQPAEPKPKPEPAVPAPKEPEAKEVESEETPAPSRRRSRRSRSSSEED